MFNDATYFRIRNKHKKHSDTIKHMMTKRRIYTDRMLNKRFTTCVQLIKNTLRSSFKLFQFLWPTYCFSVFYLTYRFILSCCVFSIKSVAYQCLTIYNSLLIYSIISWDCFYSDIVFTTYANSILNVNEFHILVAHIRNELKVPVSFNFRPVIQP